MSRIQPTDYYTQLNIFQLYGCPYKRKKGSNRILIFPGAKRSVVIPEYDEIDIDIIKDNMRTVVMTRENYFFNSSINQEGDNLSPPSDEFRVSHAHFLNVIGGIGTVCQHTNDVNHRKPPFTILPDSANGFFLKNNNPRSLCLF
jgi:hypothetical protein